MGRPISLFTSYNQKENSITNYCGLILKLLYEDNPKSFEEVLVTLIGDKAKIRVGPTFTQQTKEKDSIPDLSITQKSFSIFFENKLTNWFYNEQIKDHIDGFPESAETKILFLLSSSFDNSDLNTQVKEGIEKAEENKVIVQTITYEDFLGTIEKIDASLSFKNLCSEFRGYLDRHYLLPKWMYMLDVVNCAGTMHEIEEFVYMCPDTGGAYSHQRAKYFGPYKNKGVYQIFEIRAVIVIDRLLEGGRVSWINTDEKQEDLIKEAKSKIQKWESRKQENESIALQVFLLKGGENTYFRKDSSGGLQSSKLYFWDIAKDYKTSEELAKNLNGKTWSEFGK